jgi:hypothetical protein
VRFHHFIGQFSASVAMLLCISCRTPCLRSASIQCFLLQKRIGRQSQSEIPEDSRSHPDRPIQGPTAKPKSPYETLTNPRRFALFRSTPSPATLLQSRKSRDGRPGVGCSQKTNRPVEVHNLETFDEAVGPRSKH